MTVGCNTAFDLGNNDAEENQSDFYKHLFATAMCHLLTIMNGSFLCKSVSAHVQWTLSIAQCELKTGNIKKWTELDIFERTFIDLEITHAINLFLVYFYSLCPIG